MKMKTKKIFIIVGLFLVLLTISGQKGCETTQAAKQGLDFSIISRPYFLVPGSTIYPGDTFYVGVKIENYDTKERRGRVCVRDSVDDTLGGIPSFGDGDCDLFVVRPAERKQTTKKGVFGQTKEEVIPGVTEVYFPKEGEYFYYNIPPVFNVKPWSTNFFVSLQYLETTQATATITTGEEIPSVGQEPAMVKVSVSKTLHPRKDGYKIDLTIQLTKQQTGKIFLPDFSKENFTQIYIQLIPSVPLQCSVENKPLQNEVEVRETKTIRCSGMIYGKEEKSLFLVVTLNYGVIIEKKFPFNIVTRE